MKLCKFTYIILIFITGFGSIAGAQLSLIHLRQGETCPMLGPLPACILVFLGYLTILIATILIRKPGSKRLFYIGWIPVLTLAALGVALELINEDVCPSGFANLPQCFYSLAMAILSFTLFHYSRNRVFRP